MSRWSHATAARARKADDKAARLVQCLPLARSLKDAARKAGIPERTARRLRKRIG